MANLMLQQCRMAGYEEARQAMREWIAEFGFDLQEQINDKTVLTPQRAAALGAVDFLKDALAQMNLY